MRSNFLTNILLAAIWVLLTGELSITNFVFGFILGFLIVWMIGLSNRDTRYVNLIPRIISFLLFFTYQVIKANIEVAIDVLTPRHRMKPGIVRVPLDAKTDMEITMLSNVISLTPGSMCLDISSDRKYMYIHAMYVTDRDAFISEIKNGFERRLLEIMR